MFDTRNLSKEEQDKFFADRMLSETQTPKEDLFKYWQEICKQTQNINRKEETFFDYSNNKNKTITTRERTMLN